MEYPNISKKMYLVLGKNVDRTVYLLSSILPSTKSKTKTKSVEEVMDYISSKVDMHEINFYKTLKESAEKLRLGQELNRIMAYPILNGTLMAQLIPDKSDRRISYFLSWRIMPKVLDLKSGKMLYGLEGSALFVKQLYIHSSLMSRAYYHDDKYYLLMTYFEWLESIFPHISKDMKYLLNNYTNFSLIRMYFISRDLSLYHALEYNVSYEDSLELFNIPLLLSVACPVVKVYLPYPKLDILHDEMAIVLPINFISVLKKDKIFGEPIVLPGQVVLPFSRESALNDGIYKIVVDYEMFVIIYNVKNSTIKVKKKG